MNRGSDDQRPVLCVVVLASMRPRFMNRGSHAFDEHALAELIRLQ